MGTVTPRWICSLTTALFVACQPLIAAVGLDELIPNGVSDVWEVAHGLIDPSHDCDSDRDGLSDLTEALTGTDPHDPASRFRLALSPCAAGERGISWQSRLGCYYVIQRLNTGRWLDISVPIEGHDGEASCLLPAPADGAQFFRIRLWQESGLPPEASVFLSARDTDTDGQSDWLEWLAGTSLITGSDRFTARISTGEQFVRLSWPSMAGSVYHIERLVDSSWEPAGGPFSGTGGLISHTLPVSAPRALYRLALGMPDSDGDGLADWEEHLLGLDPVVPNSRDVTMSDLAWVRHHLRFGGVVSLESVSPVVLSRSDAAVVRLRRSDGAAPIDVGLAVSPGWAMAGASPVHLAAGQETADLHFTAAPGVGEGVVSLVPSAAFETGEVHSKPLIRIEEQLLNIRAYGAIGDGTADDTAAIQRALSALEDHPAANGLYFPEGRYRMATVTPDSDSPLGSKRLLEFGYRMPLAGRDLVLRGAPGACLYSEVSPARVNMLIIRAGFRTLSIEGLRFEQDPLPLTATPGYEPNRSDGLTISADGTRGIEGVFLRNCEFINCHRAVSVYGVGYDIRGKGGVFSMDGCKVLNPYGANTEDSASAWGGGQQIYLAAWVAEARYEGCLFEGGGLDMTDEATCPGGRLKDGCHFGSPLRLFFHNNVVRRMGVEAVFQTNGNKLLGSTTSGFTLPPADGITEVSVTVSATPSTWVTGDTIVVRTPLTPGVVASNNILTVRSYDPATRTLRVTSLPNAGNRPEGTEIPSGRVIYRGHSYEPTLAVIEGNVVDGRIPPGAIAFDAHKGICVNARALIANNYVIGHGYGIWGSADLLAPLYPATAGTVIRDNVVVTRDPVDYPNVYTVGIGTAGGQELVAGNYILSPTSHKCHGIRLEGPAILVTGNSISALNIVRNSYASPVKSVGISLMPTAGNAMLKANGTRGFDIGVGPAVFGGIVPYSAQDHTSVLDLVGLDPRGLLNP